MILVSVYLILLFDFIVVSLSSFCVFISLCFASVVLALVSLPGLYSAASRAAFLVYPAEKRIMWLPFVWFFYMCCCLCFCVLFIYVYLLSLLCPFLHGDDVLCWLLSCPLSSFLRTCSRFDLVWFCLTCDHGWTRSGLVNVR